MTKKAMIESRLAEVIALAEDHGFLIRVDLVSQRPLAMRNVKMVAEVRPALIRPEDTQEHNWTRATHLGIKSLGKVTRVCRECGIVEPRDTRKVSYCKGRTRVTLRAPREMYSARLIGGPGDGKLLTDLLPPEGKDPRDVPLGFKDEDGVYHLYRFDPASYAHTYRGLWAEHFNTKGPT